MVRGAIPPLFANWEPHWILSLFFLILSGASLEFSFLVIDLNQKRCVFEHENAPLSKVFHASLSSCVALAICVGPSPPVQRRTLIFFFPFLCFFFSISFLWCRTLDVRILFETSSPLGNLYLFRTVSTSDSYLTRTPFIVISGGPPPGDAC